MSSGRHLVCVLLVLILPLAVLAQDDVRAMLQSSGTGVSVNQHPAPPSVALFQNDYIETQKGAVARIDVSGSSADINPETSLQFEGNELVLDHGSLSVDTSHGLRVRVGCLTITPVNLAEWTHYDVTDVDGKVTIVAQKSDVYLDAQSKNPQPAKQSNKTERSIVRETEKKSRDEKCGAAVLPRGAGLSPAGILGSPWAIAGGAGTIAVLACWALCRSDNAISPDKPKP